MGRTFVRSSLPKRRRGEKEQEKEKRTMFLLPLRANPQEENVIETRTN